MQTPSEEAALCPLYLQLLPVGVECEGRGSNGGTIAGKVDENLPHPRTRRVTSREQCHFPTALRREFCASLRCYVIRFKRRRRRKTRFDDGFE